MVFILGYTALYREWRPRTFTEVVGQDHITITLKNQVNHDRIAHAYLLCGTRGTGKTSTAKILAKAVNCLNPQDGDPCNSCEMCTKINSGTAIDVIEIDAASHNKVEHIRDIIDEVKYPPRDSKFKVYILDEAHMLTSGAVNAFLKTLEEPPEHVMFILATTDPQKLPITILSRCQRFDFKRIKSDDIFNRLSKIVSEQGIYAEDKSLKLVSRMSDGAMRDALSILDQAISMGDGKVEYSQIILMLGLVTNDNLMNLTEAIIEKNIQQSIILIDDIVMSGKDISLFIKDMIQHFRNTLMVKVSNNPEEVLDMSQENISLINEQARKIHIEEIMRCIRILQETEAQSKWSKQARIYLEMAVIKMCKIEYDTSNEVLLSRIAKIERIIREGKINIVNKSNEVAESKIKDNSKKIRSEYSSKNSIIVEENTEKLEYNIESNLTIAHVQKAWKDIIDMFKAKRHMIIYASLITGTIESCKNGVVEIKYDEQYSFNKKRLEREENRTIIEKVFSEALKEKVRIIYTIDKKEDEIFPELEMIKNAFGEDFVEVIDE
ncbi:DNA polymerase-3 subunit gamma/tau [Clostridium grantii DSM 8605]|uniref:DNA-directed DNA polymerase n=1 Tax=Clostridium grantii DSM 8605 TaxID=1121316 RepID=A0A1M5XZW3_9CLOT|nr:DNA polymerase-3 subunit gamma/tau [Clostridium grantii DSM 8605]